MEYLPGRALLLCVKQVRERRFLRLVVGRQRAVDEARRRVDPAEPVRVEDERGVAAQPLEAFLRAAGPVVRRLGGREVRAVAEARPLLLVRVPPDVALALGPRLA